MIILGRVVYLSCGNIYFRSSLEKYLYDEYLKILEWYQIWFSGIIGAANGDIWSVPSTIPENGNFPKAMVDESFSGIRIKISNKKGFLLSFS